MKADIYTIGGQPGMVRLEENVLLVNLALHGSGSPDMATETVLEPHARLACLLAEKVKQEKESGNPLVDELRAVVKKHDERKRQMKQGGPQAAAPSKPETTPEKKLDNKAAEPVGTSSTETPPSLPNMPEMPKKVKDAGPVAEALYRILAGKRLKSDETTLIAAGWTIRG